MRPSCVTRYPDADAFRAGTHRKPDDRQEQNVEQLELLLLREAEDQRQRQRDRDELQQGFGRHRQDAAPRHREQRKRRHHHHADHVADPIAQRHRDEIARRQQPGGDHQAHITRRDKGGAHHGGRRSTKPDRASTRAPDRNEGWAATKSPSAIE